MILVIRLLILVFAVVLVVRTVRWVFGGSGRRELEDPVGRAQLIGERISTCLREGREDAESNPIYEDALAQIGDLLQERLPSLVESRNRVRRYLEERRLEPLRKDLDQYRKELETCSDPALSQILERNLKLAMDRLENLQRLRVLLERTNAQIHNVILALESLEDRVVAARIAVRGPDFTGQIEGLLSDVQALEQEYERLSLPA